MNLAERVPNFLVLRLSIRKLLQVPGGQIQLAELDQIVGEKKFRVVVLRIRAKRRFETSSGVSVIAQLVQRDSHQCGSGRHMRIDLETPFQHGSGLLKFALS